jgi:hypothetical protein
LRSLIIDAIVPAIFCMDGGRGVVDKFLKIIALKEAAIQDPKDGNCENRAELDR